MLTITAAFAIGVYYTQVYHYEDVTAPNIQLTLNAPIPSLQRMRLMQAAAPSGSAPVSPRPCHRRC